MLRFIDIRKIENIKRCPKCVKLEKIYKMCHLYKNMGNVHKNKKGSKLAQTKKMHKVCHHQLKRCAILLIEKFILFFPLSFYLLYKSI